MANISFRVNKGKRILDTNKEQPIYIRYKLGRSVDFNASIKMTVLIDNWDKEKQTVKNRTSILNRHEINNLIKKLGKHFEDYENKNRENGITPTYKEVKEHYDSYFTKNIEAEVKQVTLFSFIDQLIEQSKNKPHPRTKKLLSKNTVKDYSLTKNTLQAFNDEVYKVDFDTISLDWYYDFIEWCNTKGFKMNYTGKHIKTLKTFMNRALDEGITDNITHKSTRFSVYKEETDSTYLNENELLKFWSYDLSKEPRKEIARDLFLIGAHTGMRVSDYNRLTKDNIKTENGIEMIRIKTQKVGKIVVIPMHPVVRAILDKNNGNPPKKIPSQHINDLIKKVAKAIELNERVELNYNKAGKAITEFRLKHELITNHTARRSFCTNAYLANVPTLDIMAISGHTTEKNFKKYIKVTAEQTAIKLSEHPHFKNANALKIV